MRAEFLRWKDSLDEIGIPLSDSQLEQFEIFYDFLIERNKVMNLTAITELQEVMEKHFLDSIMVMKVFDLNDCNRVLDLGTGAGFPGIPLKIVFPQLDMVLVDSLQKRVAFLEELVHKLNLDNISVIHARAEDLAKQKSYRESFDLCLSRAVANLSTLSEYCLPFVKIGGRFISYKANNIEEEVRMAKKAIHVLGGVCDGVKEFKLGEDGMHRSFVIISKKKNTPASYPRKAGVPSKNPI